jgi:hypothetical protein
MEAAVALSKHAIPNQAIEQLVKASRFEFLKPLAQTDILHGPMEVVAAMLTMPGVAAAEMAAPADGVEINLYAVQFLACMVCPACHSSIHLRND